MLQHTGAWDGPISQGLVVFQAVLGHLMKSRCELLPDYNFLGTHAQSLSHVRLFATPRTIARQASLPVEFYRQEY